MSKKVKVTWIKSAIGAKENHKRTIKALGLNKLNASVEKELNPAVQGMINTVSYLVKVEEVK